MPSEFPDIQGAQLQSFMLQQGRGDVERIQRAAKKDDDASMRKASQEFEAVFVTQLLKEMRRTVPKDGLFKQSMAREWFEGMLDEAVAKEVSRGPGIGFAASIYEQMKQTAGKGGGPAVAPPAAAPAPEAKEKKP